MLLAIQHIVGRMHLHLQSGDSWSEFRVLSFAGTWTCAGGRSVPELRLHEFRVSSMTVTYTRQATSA